MKVKVTENYPCVLVLYPRSLSSNLRSASRLPHTTRKQSPWKGHVRRCLRVIRIFGQVQVAEEEEEQQQQKQEQKHQQQQQQLTTATAAAVAMATAMAAATTITAATGNNSEITQLYNKQRHKYSRPKEM